MMSQTEAKALKQSCRSIRSSVSDEYAFSITACAARLVGVTRQRTQANEAEPEFLSERRNPLGPMVSAALAQKDLSVGDQWLVECSVLLRVLSHWLALDGGILVSVILLIERAIQHSGVVVSTGTLRPLLITATVVAAKEGFDGTMTLDDVRRACAGLPLNLACLGDMERELLILVDHRATCFSCEAWDAYASGVHELAETEAVAAKWGDVRGLLLALVDRYLTGSPVSVTEHLPGAAQRAAARAHRRKRPALDHPWPAPRAECCSAGPSAAAANTQRPANG